MELCLIFWVWTNSTIPLFSFVFRHQWGHMKSNLGVLIWNYFLSPYDIFHVFFYLKMRALSCLFCPCSPVLKWGPPSQLWIFVGSRNGIIAFSGTLSFLFCPLKSAKKIVSFLEVSAGILDNDNAKIPNVKS